MIRGNANKYVVFDLDETIGHFVLIRNIWDSLHRFITYNDIKYKLTQYDFNLLLNEFLELFRPGILSILLSLKKKKLQGLCKGIMIYTNNRYSKDWVHRITDFIEQRLGGDIFDNIVLAFKLNGEIQEPCRTSKDKKYSDFIQCCRIPQDVQIELCYLDDVFHPEMDIANVYYLKVKPYVHCFSHQEIMNRLFRVKTICKILYIKDNNEKVNDKHREMFSQYIQKYLSMKNVLCEQNHPVDYNIDKLITKRMVTHIHVFFTRFFPGYIDIDDDTSSSSSSNN
jgi:hypothetical protein